jgi:hypothetical protein
VEDHLYYRWALEQPFHSGTAEYHANCPSALILSQAPYQWVQDALPINLCRRSLVLDKARNTKRPGFA